MQLSKALHGGPLPSLPVVYNLGLTCVQDRPHLHSSHIEGNGCCTKRCTAASSSLAGAAAWDSSAASACVVNKLCR